MCLIAEEPPLPRATSILHAVSCIVHVTGLPFTYRCVSCSDLRFCPLQAHQQQRREALRISNSLLPRFERLMGKLSLSDKEEAAMLYVLVKQVSQEDYSNLFPKYGRSPPSFAQFSEMVSCALSCEQHACVKPMSSCTLALLGLQGDTN